MLHVLLTVIVLFLFFCFVLFWICFLFLFCSDSSNHKHVICSESKKNPVITFHFVFKWMDYIKKAKIELNGIEWNKYMAPELQIHCVVQQKLISKTHNYG